MVATNSKHFFILLLSTKLIHWPNLRPDKCKWCKCRCHYPCQAFPITGLYWRCWQNRKDNCPHLYVAAGARSCFATKNLSASNKGLRFIRQKKMRKLLGRFLFVFYAFHSFWKRNEKLLKFYFDSNFLFKAHSWRTTFPQYARNSLP